MNKSRNNLQPFFHKYPGREYWAKKRKRATYLGGSFALYTGKERTSVRLSAELSAHKHGQFNICRTTTYKYKSLLEA